MAFNPLIDLLPLTWQGVEVKTDFRQPLRFFRLLKDREIDERDKAEIVLKLFFERLPEQTTELWAFVQWFIAAGDDSEKEESGKQIFDFEVDSGRVFAAFWQTYGIDLTERRLHWWKFLELFQALPENTMLMKVIDIRGKEIPQNADQKYARQLRKAKARYAIETASFDSLREWFKGAG